MKYCIHSNKQNLTDEIWQLNSETDVRNVVIATKLAFSPPPYVYTAAALHMCLSLFKAML